MAVSLSQIRVEAVFDAQGYVSGANAKASADTKMVQSGQQLAGSLEQTERRLTQSGGALERFARSIDPAYASQQKLATGTATLQRALEGGNITTERHAQLLTLLQQRYSAIPQSAGGFSTAINDNHRAMGQATSSAGQLRFAVQNLSFQFNDIATSLASGGSPFRVLAQQSGQVVQAFQQGGGVSAVLGAAGRSIAGMITPVTAAAAGVAALAGGFAFLVTRAISAQSEIRSLDVLLRGMGGTSLASGSSLDAAARRLRDVGLTPQEASAQITAVTRAGLNPASAERVVRTGANLVPVLGDSATQSLTTALSGGLESAIKFGQAIHALDGEQVTLFRTMARGGDTVKALDQIFSLIEARAKGLHRDALSPVGQKMEDLRISTANLIDTMAKSTVISKAVEILNGFVTGLDNLANLKPPAWMLALIPGASLPSELRANFGGSASSGVVASAAIPSAIPGASDAELALLAEIRRRESSGVYNTFHATGAQVGSLADVEALRGFKSHAFGGYGFQPGTYRSMASQTGLYDISPGSQDINALALLRKYGPNSTASWGASGPYNSTGIAAAAGGASITRPDDIEKSKEKLDEFTRARKEQLEVEKGLGLEQDLARARQEAEKQNLDAGLKGNQALVNIQLAEAAARQKVQIEQQKQTESSRLEVVGTLKVAEAYGISAAAGLRMQAVVQATIETRAKFGNEFGQSASGEAEIARRSAELVAEQSAKSTLALQQGINTRTDQIAVSQLEVQLQGKTTEEIAAQVSLLQEKQKLLNSGVDLTDAIAQKDLASVAALGKQNIALSEAQRAQGRIDDGFRSLGNTIDSALTQRISDAFNGNKVKSWGETLKSVLSSAMSWLSSNLFVKPLIGTLLSGLGLTGAASSFGSFGNLFGSSSSSSSGGGLLSGIGKLFGLGDSGLGSLGGIGGLLTEGPATVFGTGLGAEGAAFGVGDALGGLGLGSIFGFGGAALGLGSLLFGLFDSKPKPKNFFSNQNIDLGTGALSGFTSGGKSQNDSAAKSVGNTLSSFITDTLKSLPGASLNGTISIGAGSVAGIVADIVDQAGSSHLQFSDASSATNQLELEIVKRLSGISDTMKTVFGKLTDASQIASAITFSKGYDDPRLLADAALSGLPTDTGKIGAYKTALDSLNSSFQDATTQANKFGLSLDPLTKGLATAKDRLLTDFATEFANADLALLDPVKAQVNSINTAAKAELKDAEAIGADITQVNKLTADQLKKVWTDATSTVQSLLDSLKTGSLSGKSAAEQAKAANDNYKKELALVQGGNLSEAGNLATAGNTLISAYQSVYGNAPITAAARKTLIADLDKVMSSRSFASGADYTPPGWVQLHKDEWINQPGGMTVLPKGISPPGGGSLGPKIDRMIALLEGNNAIGREHGSISERGFRQIVGTLDKPVLTETRRTKVA